MDNRIDLTDAITSLRRDLERAIAAGSKQDLRFEVGEIQLQLQVEIETSKEVGGGIKAWIVEATAGAQKSTTVGHTVTIPLTPIHGDGDRVLTGESVTAIPK